ELCGRGVICHQGPRTLPPKLPGRLEQSAWAGEINVEEELSAGAQTLVGLDECSEALRHASAMGEGIEAEEDDVDLTALGTLLRRRLPTHDATSLGNARRQLCKAMRSAIAHCLGWLDASDAVACDGKAGGDAACAAADLKHRSPPTGWRGEQGEIALDILGKT